MLVGSACSSSDSNDGGASQTAGPNGAPPPASVTFMAGFKPQANLPFVGVYVGQEKGYFADENLTVDIKHVTTPGDNFRFLAAGEVQFTTADAQEVLNRRAADPPLDIVSLALIGQRGQQGFAVKADSGIQTPKDWVGKTAGYKGSEVTPDYLAILKSQGVDRASVKEVKVGFEPQVLTEGQVDIYPVFVSNEPDTLKRAGQDVKVFEAKDFGAPTLGLTFATTGDYVRQNPDIVQRFLRGAIRGIHYADKHRDEALDIVLKYAPGEDREHERYMMETELKGAFSGEALLNGLGAQTKDEWQRLHDFLVQYGALPTPLPDVSAAFTDQFLLAAHEPPPWAGGAAPTPASSPATASASSGGY